MDWATIANVFGFVSLIAAGFTIAKVESDEHGGVFKPLRSNPASDGRLLRRCLYWRDRS